MPATYSVRSGDTLSSIAARYKVPLSTLVKANNIANPDRIWQGMTLTIPDQGKDGFSTGRTSTGSGSPAITGVVPITAPPKPTSASILAAAVERSRTHGADYAVAAAGVSCNKTFPGNKVPDQTPLESTRGKWKCNMFVGDVLTAAGCKPPQYSGEAWYALSQEWHNYTDLFDVIPPEKARPGDILTIDRTPLPANKKSEGGGHVVVLATAITGGSYEAYGATETGAVKTQRTIAGDTAGLNGKGEHFKVYVLRPKNVASTLGG